VKSLAKKEAMRGKRIQNMISKTLKLKCQSGYELHDSSICRKFRPVTTSLALGVLHVFIIRNADVDRFSV